MVNVLGFCRVFTSYQDTLLSLVFLTRTDIIGPPLHLPLDGPVAVGSLPPPAILVTVIGHGGSRGHPGSSIMKRNLYSVIVIHHQESSRFYCFCYSCSA